MPNAYGRAFTTANFLSNLAALKAINFGASDPSGVWFLVKNPTGNSDIWLWEPTSTAVTNETSVVRPDSIEPNSPGRCVKSLVDANNLGGILAAIALLNTAGLIERTADGSAAIVGLGAFAKTFLGSASDTAARATLNLGNVTNTSDAAKPVSTAQQTALNLKANLASPTFTGTVAGITAAMVGLGNVTNTSDANKPISIAQQTALNLKADLINGTVPAAQLPSFVDDVLEFATLASFPATGETGKLYVAINTNLVYRWTGTIYVAISDSLALGITSSSAYRGDLGNTAYLHSQIIGNPHGTTKADLGLGAVDNTSDVAKPISTLQQSALDLKANANNPIFTGFTTLGDNIAIKKKILTGTTAAAQGNSINVSHGLTSSKIIAVTGLIFYSASGCLPFGSRQSGCGSFWATDTVNFSLTNETGNSGSILSKTFYAVIEYVA